MDGEYHTLINIQWNLLWLIKFYRGWQSENEHNQGPPYLVLDIYATDAEGYRGREVIDQLTSNQKTISWLSRVPELFSHVRESL